MNLERGITNTIPVMARQVAGETHYLLVFQSVDRAELYQYCITTNAGSAAGPLLLDVIETDNATAVDGEVTLGVGDWKLTVYGQDNGTNLDAALSDRQVWTELLRVSSDDVDPAIYPPNGGGSGTAPDADRCRYIRVCGDPTDGQVPTYNATADRYEPEDPTGGGGGGVTDHGALTGLADDDHSQYHNNTRGDERYAQRTNNLSDLSSASTARTNLGLGTAATANTGDFAAASHTHVSADITDGSTGGNGALDAGKVVKFGADGQLWGTANDANSAIYGQSSGNAYAGYFQAASTLWPAVYVNGSGSGTAALQADKSGGGVGLDVSSTEKAARFHALSFGSGTPDIVDFVTGVAETLKLAVKFDGGLEWTGTGAQTTATNLPTFGALTKGVVPAAGAVPSANNFLTETGVYAVPAGTGINQLTGDVTAGPGSGSQAATLASVITAGGPTGSASVVPVITYDAKGRLTAVTTATVTPAAIGAPSGSGTSTGTNTGDQTTITGNAGTATALQTGRTIQTDLASGTAATFDGTANITPGVTGTLPIANGGTGATSAATARTNLLVDRFSGVLTSDQTLSSTTLTDIASLSGFSLAASATYHFIFTANVTTNATSIGILCTVNASAAVSSLNMIAEYPTSATAWTSETISALQGGTVPSSGPGATSRRYQISGSVTTSSACTFGFQFRSEEGSQVTIKRGSSCLITRVA